MAIIDISKKTATDLLNPLTGQYFIPDNQRTFSWDDDQVEDLLQDIMTAYEDSIRGDDASHFMGMIVFYEDDQQNPKKLYIYDGQQRITNLILFFLACSRAYEDFGKKNDVENYKVFSNKIINRSNCKMLIPPYAYAQSVA